MAEETRIAIYEPGKIEIRTALFNITTSVNIAKRQSALPSNACGTAAPAEFWLEGALA